MTRFANLCTRVTIACLILAVSVDCDNARRGTPCPAGTHAVHCQTFVRDKCGVVEPLKHTFGCVNPGGEAGLRKTLNATFLAMRPDCISEIDTDCSPTPDGLIPPQDEDTTAVLVPEPEKAEKAWGDKACSACVNVSECKSLAVTCASTVGSNCKCWDTCGRDNNTLLDAEAIRAACVPKCGEPDDTTNAFVNCAHAACPVCVNGPMACGVCKGS